MAKLIQVRPDVQIGLDAGEWVVECSREVVRRNQGKYLLSLYPLLESSYHNVNQQVEDYLAENRLPRTSIESFPVIPLVEMVMHEGSEYWKDKALDWLEEMPPRPEFLDWLKGIWLSRGWPQKLQHRAKRLHATLARTLASRGCDSGEAGAHRQNNQ